MKIARKGKNAVAMLAVFMLLVSMTVKGDGKSELEKSIERQGFVDIQSVDSTIRVSLMYSRPDNFTGCVLYTDLHRAYLHPEAARALKRAQSYLRRHHPHLSLKVYDAARPMRVQQRMWKVVEHTSKDIYVSNPAHGGGLHNYGMAVDLTLCDEKGDSLTMGTRIDYMGAMAHVTNEQHFLSSGQLTARARRNRLILREAMKAAGWRQLPTEWWHYNFVSRKVARAKYKVIK